MWARAPGAPASTPWVNIGSHIANFNFPEAATITTTSLIALRGIITDTGGPVTIAGAPPMRSTGLWSIDVRNAPLFLNTTVANAGGTLTKRGPGLLAIGGNIMTSALIIEDGLVSLSGGNLNNTVNIRNMGVLMMDDSVTIAQYTQTAGHLTGTGTLSATNGAILESGSIAGKLNGNTTIAGDVEISGSTGNGKLTISAGTLTLSGSSTNSLIDISEGASLVNASGRLDALEAGIQNSGKLKMDASDTIHDYVQSRNGELTGTGTLTATKAAFLDGGTVSGNLASLSTSVRGNVLVSGAISGTDLSIAGRSVMTLSGVSTHANINILGAGTLLDTHGGLDASASVENAGTLTVDSDDTVSNYTQLSGTSPGTGSQPGILDGKGTLTVTGVAALDGGTVSGNLMGKVFIRGHVMVSGHIGGDTLTVDGSGSLGLTGSTSHDSIVNALGSLDNFNGGFADRANVANAGVMTIHADDTVLNYTQHGRPEGTLQGPGTLTVTGEALLEGGTVSAGISGNVTSKGVVMVSGNLGGGTLAVSDGRLDLTGISTNSKVDISATSTLVVGNGGLDANAEVTNHGILTLNANDTVSTYTQQVGKLWRGGVPGELPGLALPGQDMIWAGALRGTGTLTAQHGATLHGGTIEGALEAYETRIEGNTQVTGSISGEKLSIANGALNLSGRSKFSLIEISHGAWLDASGDIGETSEIINSGGIDLDGRKTISRMVNHGGIVDGTGELIVTGPTIFNGGELAGNLTANLGATLNHGTKITGILDASTTTRGDVLILGRVGGGGLEVQTGTLTLNGTVNAFTDIAKGAAVRGTGRIVGDVANRGVLGSDSIGDRTLDISGSLVTQGLVNLSLTNATDFDRIKVGGIAALGGNLIVTNTGTGLQSGQVAGIIDAGAYIGEFEGFSAIGFDNGVLFDDATGRLIGMSGGTGGSAQSYLNLNPSQTKVYLSLYEDSVEIGSQNVIFSDGSLAKHGARQAKAAAAIGDTTEFTSGLSDGDPQLVEALNLATFTTPGSILQPVINQLSPEVHRGMADYTEQALRSHLIEALDAAPVSRVGRTQVFATVHSSMAGVDSTVTDAGYDIQMTGITSGMRYDIDKRMQVGGLLGLDDGNIEGGLIDTDAQGLVVGTFARYLIDEKSGTTLTGSLSYGGYDFDAERESFQGPASANDISSDAVEISVGVRTTAYDKHGVRVTPKATLRYLGGNVDGFTESGPGVPLKVGGQDIESVLLDLGAEVDYKPIDKLALVASLDYVCDFSDSSEQIDGSFVSSGALAQPFAVSAPGIEDEAVVLGLGAFYDVNETIRVGLNYRADFRFDSQDAHTFGIGASFGF